MTWVESCHPGNPAYLTSLHLEAYRLDLEREREREREREEHGQHADNPKYDKHILDTRGRHMHTLMELPELNHKLENGGEQVFFRNVIVFSKKLIMSKWILNMRSFR